MILDGPSIIAPAPIFLVILAWIIWLFALLVLPAIYFATAYFGMRWSRYPALVLGMVLLFAALNIWYFVNAWSYGIKWQGESHTYAVTIINAICFAIVGILAVLGVAKNSMNAARNAHLALFVVLSWCAFPYLGELP